MANCVKELNGNLILKAMKTATYCSADSQGQGWAGSTGPCTADVTYLYICGYIETRAVFNIKYGLIEARIKLP